MTAVTPLNIVRQFVRSSQLLSDITCRSIVNIPWPSNLYCVIRGVFNSTKHIGMEYIRVTFLCTHTSFPLSMPRIAAVNVIILRKSPKFHRYRCFRPLCYPAVMIFEEVHVTLTIWRQKTTYVTFTSYLTEMRETPCFALQVKIPSSLPTVRRSGKLEAIALDSGRTSHSNTTVGETTRATPCGQNSATLHMD